MENKKILPLPEGETHHGKTEKHIWVKASGAALATIDEEGFAVLDRKK